LVHEHKPDIIAISETWLKPEVLSSEFLSSNYNIFRKDRPDGYGGILIACRNSLNCHHLDINFDTEAIACHFILPNHQTLVLCAFYRPPNRQLDSITNLCDFFRTIVDRYPTSPIWITGDINLPNINWNTNNISNSMYPSSLCDTIIDFVEEHGFTQTVNTATRGNNILDVFLTNRPSLVKSCHVVPGISDHEAVVVESSISSAPHQHSLRTIYVWHKANITSIRSAIDQFSSNFFTLYSTSTSIDILWEEFKSLCSNCLSYIPTKLCSSENKKPWINSHIKRLSRKKQRLYNLAKSSHCPSKWQTYKNFKKTVQQESRRAYHRYISSLTDRNGRITKRLWSYIKKQRKDNLGVTSLRHNDSTYNHDRTKAQLLNNYFTSVFTPHSSETPPVIPDPQFPDIASISIDVNGVRNLLNELDTSKATGPDKIPTHLLKLCATEFAPILTLIFQASIHQSRVPPDWKQANIVPIFKKGDRTLCSNYRPVSLTCICSKILEHIIYTHIFSHLSQHNILCDEQHGFRHGRSCETQLILAINDFAETLNNKGQTDLILLDFSKAFDKVSHEHLYHKLHHYGIRGNTLEWLKDFLTGRKQQVLVNGEQSDSTQVTSGVPQGTVLAPLLFLCFINDLPKNILSTVRIYADDVILYTPVNSIEDCYQLQNDLATLERWANQWKMTFNIQKCEFLRITLKKKPILHQYTLYDTVVQEVTQTKYLGLTIDSRLSWTEHIRQITKKANNVKGFLQRNLQSCPISVKESCYKSFIKPILEYACVVWDPYKQKDILAIESVQRRCARFVCNNYSSYASVTNMLQNLNWPSLASSRHQLKAIALFKIMHQLVVIPTDTILQPAPSSYHLRGHSMKLAQPSARVDVYLHSFFPSSIKIWNNLPTHLITCSSLDQFKANLTDLEL